MADPDETRRVLQISCADALELMTDFLEHALSPADAARMRAHLAGCEACGVYLDQLRATIRVARASLADEEFAVAPDRVEDLVQLFRRAGNV